ncbi:MAG: Na/Pi symporter [Bacillota bacterium]|nr:Na/Pi symporter [Bacillota bacterium]
MAAAWLVVGIGAFLVGIRSLTAGLERLGGRAVRRSLGRYGQDPALAWLLGAGAAALLHSSGVVTVAVVSLVEAGAVGFPAAIGAVLGANVGTTATAQLMSFSTTTLGWLAAVAGGALLAGHRSLFRRVPKAGAAGQALLGVGLVFLGLEALGGACGSGIPAWLPGWLSQVADRPVVGVLAGTVFTGLVQSSTLFIGLVMNLAAQGLLTLTGAIHLVLGGNIGSCLPGLLAGVAAGRAGRWAGLVNLVFNVAGAAAVLPFVPGLANLVAATSPSFARQVANAHALFNLATAAAALPLAWPVGRWLEKGIAAKAANGKRGPGGAATREAAGRR